jgi:hypothetical protein
MGVFLAIGSFAYYIISNVNVGLWSFIPDMSGNRLLYLLGVSCWLGSYLLMSFCSLAFANIGSKSAITILSCHRPTRNPLNSILYHLSNHLGFICLSIVPALFLLIGFIYNNEFALDKAPALTLIICGVITIFYFASSESDLDIIMIVFPSIGLLATLIILFLPHFNLFLSTTERILAAECIVGGILSEFEV